MANGEDSEDESPEKASGEESSNQPPSEPPESEDQVGHQMTERTPREELKESFDRNQLIRRNIDQGIDTVLRMNPVENVLKNIEDDEIEEEVRDQVQAMMNDWLDMYRSTLEEGRTLPADLIGRSAELAKANRDDPRTEEDQPRR